MRGKNKTRRLKLKRSKLHSLKLRKRKRRKTKKRGGAGKYTPSLKTIKEGVQKRPLAKSPRKPSSPASLSSPTFAEMENYGYQNIHNGDIDMGWL